VRLALCGLGSAALRAHAPAIGELIAQGRIEVVGVSDRSLERRAMGASLFEAPGFADLHRMLHELEPDIVVVATPPSRHLEAVRTGLNHHAHVVCEKPLGLRRHDVGELERLHRRHGGLSLVTVHQYEFASPWQRFSRQIRAAVRHGEPWQFRAEVERPGTDPLSAGGWRARPAVEGGILGDHAVHYLSLAWLADPSVSVGACARSGEPGRETASVALALERGQATVAVSYAGHGRRNRIALDVPAAGFHLDWQDESLTVTRRGGPGSVRRVEALSSRQFVNDLYGPLYDELLDRIADPAWRAARTAETLGVARLLAASLEAAGTAR
jgi:predicted dehydrogenase